MNTDLFFDFAGREIKNGTQIERDIPPQFSNQAEAKVFSDVVSAFETIELGDGFVSNLWFNTLIAGSLQSIWSLINSQQIIILLPFLAAAHPANAQAMFSVFLKIAAFEAIPTNWIYENMLERLEKETIQDKLIFQTKKTKLSLY